MGARSIKEIVQCPDLMQWERELISVSASSSGNFRKDFDIKLGGWEAIDLYGVIYGVHLGNVISVNSVVDCDIGLSILEREKNREDTSSGTAHLEFTEREDMLLYDNYTFAAGAGTAEQVLTSYSKHIWFPIPFCLIRPPTFELDVTVSGTTTGLTGYMTVYYVKRGVAKTIYLQLLKYWQDAKSIFKTGLPNEYDT